MVDRLIDNLVVAVAPDPRISDSLSSVKIEIICAVSAPIILLTDIGCKKQLRITTMLLLNVFVRLLYPSCYFPATARANKIVAHPLTARIIAFMAEFGLYEVWALWVNQDFWGSTTYLWALVLMGECISTIALILQSEMMFFMEDLTWTIHTSYMCGLSVQHSSWPLRVLFFGGFAIHMIAIHLPRRFVLLRSRGELWSMDPLFGIRWGTKKGQNKVRFQPCDFEELAWVVPMLLAQPILTALMYYDIGRHSN